MRAPAAGASSAAAWAPSRRPSPPMAARKGLEIRTNAEVIAIDTGGGSATGVTLADGTRIEAPVVASNVSAKLTFLKFLPRAALPADFVRDVESYRTYSTAFKINIACERLPRSRRSIRPPAASPIRRTRTSGRRSSISSAPTTTPSAATGRAIRSSPSVTPSFVDRHDQPAGQARRASVRRPCAVHACGRGLGDAARTTSRRTCFASSTSMRRASRTASSACRC